MHENKFLIHIGELIGKDDLPEAIHKLSQLLQNSPKLDEVIIQSARYNDIQKQIRSGIVNFEEANVTKNKIRFAILDIIREIEFQLINDEAINKEVLDFQREKADKVINQTHHGSGDNIAGDKIIYK